VEMVEPEDDDSGGMRRAGVRREGLRAGGSSGRGESGIPDFRFQSRGPKAKDKYASFPRKRESRAAALDPRFRGGDMAGGHARPRSRIVDVKSPR
jgi:hypothetical protein